jgi:hypothetical protein
VFSFSHHLVAGSNTAYGRKGCFRFRSCHWLPMWGSRVLVFHFSWMSLISTYVTCHGRHFELHPTFESSDVREETRYEIRKYIGLYSRCLCSVCGINMESEMLGSTEILKVSENSALYCYANKNWYAVFQSLLHEERTHDVVKLISVVRRIGLMGPLLFGFRRPRQVQIGNTIQ